MDRKQQKFIADQLKKDRARLESEFREKLHQLRTIDLQSAAKETKEMEHVMKDLTPEQEAEVDRETGEVAEAYSEMLNRFADFLENPDDRRSIFEELKKIL